MTVIIKEFFRVSCDICDWTRTYGSFHQIPQDIRDGKCPSCGSNWEIEKEEMHKRIREKHPKNLCKWGGA